MQYETLPVISPQNQKGRNSLGYSQGLRRSISAIHLTRLLPLRRLPPAKAPRDMSWADVVGSAALPSGVYSRFAFQASPRPHARLDRRRWLTCHSHAATCPVVLWPRSGYKYGRPSAASPSHLSKRSRKLLTCRCEQEQVLQSE
ncbi:hypothetical protein Cni_G28044 [Canna indica]|uniref:Uncharacterized protein n=1 Tax=Canna indica TaxID=4628 RepID=A0AAQ3QS04_9LILI|nr:hypothetical protein Cni_G28044 [Canna indica]